MIKSISIDEFDRKEFRSVFDIQLPEEPKAVLTHYLHNIDSEVSKHYENDAMIAFQTYIEYGKSFDSSLINDIALQQLLFEVENVPFKIY